MIGIDTMIAEIVTETEIENQEIKIGTQEIVTEIEVEIETATTPRNDIGIREVLARNLMNVKKIRKIKSPECLLPRNKESTVLHGAETASARSLTLGKKVTKVHLNAGTTGKRRMHLFPLNPKPRGILTTKNVGRLKR